MRLALITARGGSNRIPKKNVRPFANQGPMITLPIKALLSSGLFEEVCVDTDSEEIAEISRNAGASVPYLRPTHLAQNNVPTLEVVRHAISRLRLKPEDELLVAYPTNYLTPEHYRLAFEAFNFGSGDFLVSVTPVQSRVDRLFSLGPQSKLLRLEVRHDDGEVIEPQLYTDAGKFYLGRVSSWVTTTGIFDSSEGFRLDWKYGIDVDTPDDWNLAEEIYRTMPPPSE